MLLEASGGFWGLLETSGVRRSRRFDSWSASQSPFRQLECVAQRISHAPQSEPAFRQAQGSLGLLLEMIRACMDF